MITSKTLPCGCSVSSVYSDKVNRAFLCHMHMTKFENEQWYRDYINTILQKLEIELKELT